MASTERSAVDYIRNGRAALVRGLRNLQLIERTLRERALLPGSEIDLIFSHDAAPADQVTQLLDAAAEKGEDVCYELLRVFDDTRDQTFPMPGGEHPELHQWISCFSFGHDPQHQSDDMADSGPCAKYQKQLKIRAMQILHEKWMQSMTFLKYKAKEKSFRYIPLVLDTDGSAVHHTKTKVYKKTRTKKLKKSIPTDKRKLSPYQLLTSNEKKILLVGKPGIGKTTVVQEMLRMWTDGEDSQVSYMFYFDEPLMKLMSKSAENESLSSFLFNKYLMPIESPDNVWKDVEDNSENVVIIFDGFMDIVSDSVIERILKKEILNDAKVLITCRPEADVAGDLSDWASFRVEVQGFSETSIREYFKLMLGINDDTNISVLNNLELFSLCHVPMYAFIVTACILFSPSEADNQPCTITEMYVRIFRYCIALHHENIGNLDKYIQEKMNNIMFLASTSYQAILSKTVNLADICLKDTVQHAFLTPVTFDRTSVFCQTAFVFLHNTMQEFWAALFLLMTPDKIGHILKQSQTEEGKYLKYVITFLCGLLSEKMGNYLKCLVSHDQVKSISAKYFKDIMNTFLYSVEEDEPEPYVEPENVLYVCQCLYEYQAPEACLFILKKIDNRVDLNEQSLDPHQCCAVSYVISQSTAQTVQLDLTNCAISDPGVKLILGLMTNLKSLSLSSGPMQCQIWRVALQESSTDFDNLLRLFGFEMHLSVQEQQNSKMFQNTKDVLTAKRQNKVKLYLHMDTQQFAAKSLLENIYGSLHNIADLRVISTGRSSEVLSFQMDLFLQGALYEMETGQTCVPQLLSLNSHFCLHSPSEQSNFICTLYLRAKQMGVLAVLQPVFQAWPSYWVVDLANRKTSLFFLVELLKFHSKISKMKKPVEIWGSAEEQELRILLQCLPYVSQVRFSDYIHNKADDTKAAIKVLVDLFICASEIDKDNYLKMLSSVCSYSSFPFADDTGENQSTFLLELYSYVIEYESRTGRSVLSALLPIYQSAPTVWVIDLSKSVTSLLYQTMQLQGTKRPVELKGWTTDETEPRNMLTCIGNFLQCLPLLSQLRLELLSGDENKSVRKTVIDVILGLFICASEKGDDTLKILYSLCSYSSFPFADDTGEIQSIFLVELYSFVKEYETQTGRNVLPALLPIYQSAPSVWVLDLSKGVTSFLYQTMQLQATKKPVELRGWTNNEKDLKCFLQCLCFMSQLRFSDLGLILNDDISGAVKLVVHLFISASESGAETLNILSSVCSYSTFPFADDTGEVQSTFLLELYSYVREFESQTGRCVLPALKPIYQSAPATWVIHLSKGVTPLLCETMQVQAMKRPVEIRGLTTDESELRTILHCVPYMLELKCSGRFFQSVCEVLSTGQNWNPVEVATLLRPLNFTVTLMEMLPRRICSAVGRVLSQADPKEHLCLSLIPQSISWQGMNALFSAISRLQKLRMNEYATLKISKMAKVMSQRSVTIEEISLVSTIPNPTERTMYKLISNLASIMRVWTVRSLDLTKFHVEGHFLILLLCLDGSVSVRLPDRNVQQIAEIVYETQDDHVTRFFLEKIGGDLSSSSLPWNILHYLLQKANLPLMVDPKKNRFGTLNIQHLLPLLQSIRFNGTDSQFVRNALNEIYASHAGHLVTNLVRSSDNWINLSEQELESYECAALRFALHYSDDVKLNLLGTVIPKEEAENILQLLHRVSELRVDRHLLLNLLNACSRSREQKKVTPSLLMALHNKLDLSQSSTANLFGQESRKTLSLSDVDCRSISTAIQLSARDTELIMFDCEASDGTLLELFPALRHIHLSLDKPELLRLMLLTRYVEEARALARSLGKEIDLSHTTLNSCACEVLGLVLEHSEHLSHLNLSHCKLTDSCLNLLLPHLHKVQELDLSNNDITDTGAQKLQNFLVRTQTVHIFNNHITDMSFFLNNQYNPVVSIEIDHNWPTEKGDHSKFLVTDDPVFMMKPSIGILTKKITTVTIFDPEISVHDDVIVYRFECEMGGEFQCRATELVFGMKDRGCVEYRVIHWDIGCFSNNNYEPAGPLYDIKTTIGEIYLLHLPHCEAEADALGDISVAHMHDGVTEILTPVQITSTHVTVRISGLSTFRILRRKGCMTRYVRGQVLLFLDQINRVEQRLWVFLLARNVSATEIKKEHEEFTPIKTSSDCILRQKGKYCLSSSLKKYKVQPKTYVFHDTSHPDHHSAFELFFGSEVSELRVRIHEKRSPKREITKWNRRVILKCNDNRAYKIKTEGGTNGKGNCLLTEKKWRSSLSDLLDELHEDELKKMKAYMRDYTDFAPIPKGKLEKKERHELVDLIVETWGFQTSVQAVACIMRKLPRNDYAVTSILKPYQIQFGLITEQENTDF
ncbi:hypothetical protein SRHO_G00028590 [Serrasalmus rhombeus]